jgi:hypothetical protein
LHEAEIENLAGWNLFGCAAERFLGELDGALSKAHRPIHIDRLAS